MNNRQKLELRDVIDYEKQKMSMPTAYMQDSEGRCHGLCTKARDKQTINMYP